jgi:hypothetical protein
MATKVKSIKSVLAEFEKAFAQFQAEQSLTVPVAHRHEWINGTVYSREYATVIPRTVWFDKGFEDGRAFSKQWFSQQG